MQQINKKDARLVWKDKYTPEKFVINSGPIIQGTTAVPIDERRINVPITSKNTIERIQYIHFASTALARVNLGVKLDRRTTDKAWRIFVDYIFKNRNNMRQSKVKVSDLLAQVPFLTSPDQLRLPH